MRSCQNEDASGSAFQASAVVMYAVAFINLVLAETVRFEIFSHFLWFLEDFREKDT
jgi:hypothetical protein